MAIRSGIGIGAAQVIDTRDIMDASARQIAQQQKAQALQAEKEAKAAEKYDEKLADIMVGLKTTGARERDIPEIMASWREVKDFHEKSANIKESQRPLFMSTLKNMVNTVNDSAIRSKDLQSRLYSGASTISQNPWDYDPKVFKDIEYINNTPISKLGAMSNFNPLDYQRLPNFETINNIYKDTYGIGQKNSKFIEELREGGKRRNLSRVGEDVIKTDLIQRFTNSPEATKAISYRYSKQFGKQPTNEDLTNYIMDEYKAKYGLDYLGEIKDLKEARGGGGDETESSYSQPIELNIPFAEGKGFVNVKDYVKLPLAKQNFAGSGYIDMATGQPSTEALESSNDYEVVGVGNFPIITRGNMKGSVSQPRFAEQNPNAVKLTPMVHVQKKVGSLIENLLVPYDRLPPSSKTKKGLANFTPAGKTTTTTQKTKGTYAGLDKDGDPIFK